MIIRLQSSYCMNDERTVDPADSSPPIPQWTTARFHDAPGSVIGPYKLISLLGEGGFGTVYLAEQSTPVHRRVAVKLIRPGMDSKSVVARFEQERQALALMDHPSVAKVFDGGLTPQSRPYFVMELVRGEPITRYCELERLTVDDRVRLMIQVCSAVQHAHMKGVLHRDLKPSNILVTSVDGDPLPKVIDFGVAKALHQRLSDTTVYTEMGQMIGTPEYMSPEQARGSVDVDTRADIYALGAILYELLTGVTPVDLKESRRAGIADIERAIEQVQPAPPSMRLSQLMKTGAVASVRATELPETRRRIKGELDWIVLKCLEKERSRRYESAAAFAEDLNRYLNDEPVLAGPPSITYRAMKFVRRHRIAVTAALLVTLTLIGGIIGTGYGLAKAVREAEAARQARDESEAVTNFLTSMIESVQPDEAGKDVTVREVLDASSPRLALEFRDRPTVEARLRHALGVSYWGLGRLQDADQHLPAAVELRRSVLGPDHSDTLVSTANLASLRLEQGRLDEAETLLNEVLERASRNFGDEHAITLGAMSNLAVIYSRRNDREKSIEMNRRVVTGQERAQGPHHPHTLGAKVNLADGLAELGRFDEAEPLLRQAAGDWEQYHGSEKPGTLIALQSLAMMELGMGRVDEAERTMRSVVETRKRVLGEHHIDTLTSTANLGTILSTKGASADAETALTAAWMGFCVELGDGHPTTLRVLMLLAGVIEEQGWPERTRDLVKSFVESCRRAALRTDLSPTELNNIAWLLLYVEPADLRDATTAMQVAQRACDADRAQGGHDLWMFLDTLASAQHALRQSVAALANQREAIRLLPAAGEQYRAEMEQRAKEYERAADAMEP